MQSFDIRYATVSITRKLEHGCLRIIETYNRTESRQNHHAVSNNRHYFPIIVVLSLGFVALAYFARGADTLPGEVRLSIWVQSWQPHWIDNIARLTKPLGIPIVYGSLVIITCVALYIKKCHLESVFLFAITIAGLIILIPIETLVASPPPNLPSIQVFQETNLTSFPSDHATLYTTFLSTIFVTLSTNLKNKWTKHIVQTTLILILMAISLSRVYIGVHWLSDVLAGCILGIILVGVGMLIRFRYAHK